MPQDAGITSACLCSVVFVDAELQSERMNVIGQGANPVGKTFIIRLQRSILGRREDSPLRTDVRVQRAFTPPADDLFFHLRVLEYDSASNHQ